MAQIQIPTAPRKPRISKGVGIAMITLAGFFDFWQFVFTLLPFIGWLLSTVVSIFAGFVFWLWTAHYGVSIFDSKRILGTLGMFIGEIPPFINGVPWWTFRIYTLVQYEWWKGGTV